MVRVTTVSDSVVIAAPPDKLYEKVSDPTQMGRWSPEATGATVLSDAPNGAYEGMTFDGHNRRGFRRPWNPAIPRWTTRCVVTAAEPAERFAFQVIGQRMGGKDQPRLRMKIATWEYRFEEAGGGTRVTEQSTDDRDGSRFGRWSRRLDRIFTGGSTFPELTARNIETTLARLKEDTES